MKKLFILYVLYGLTFGIQGMDREALRRQELLEMIDELEINYKLLTLWKEFNEAELIKILTTALEAKYEVTGAPEYKAILLELKNPHYNSGEKAALLSFQFKQKELVEVLQAALRVKIYGDKLNDMKEMKE